MTPKRVYSHSTIYFAWILPILVLGFWTPVSIIVALTPISIGLKIYLIAATSVCWIIYRVVKPWQFKKVFETERGLTYTDADGTKLILFDQIKSINSVVLLKLSTISVRYEEDGLIKKIRFISSLLSPPYELPDLQLSDK